jgi:hypothetical protein
MRHYRCFILDSGHYIGLKQWRIGIYVLLSQQEGSGYQQNPGFRAFPSSVRPWPNGSHSLERLNAWVVYVRLYIEGNIAVRLASSRTLRHTWTSALLTAHIDCLQTICSYCSILLIPGSVTSKAHRFCHYDRDECDTPQFKGMVPAFPVQKDCHG